MSEQHTDVVIAGGGLSALVAAVELLEQGARVTIVDKRPRAELGGQAIDAFGGIFFVDTPEQRRVGVKDSPELAWEDWLSYADFAPDADTERAWARRYVERSTPDVREWLVSRGVRFFPVVNWAERAHDGRGNRVPRFHLTWGCGTALVTTMLGHLEPHEGKGLTILTDHEVDGLVTSTGADGTTRVTGVRGTHGGTPFEVSAEHVVVASGGRTGDLDKVRASWPQRWHDAPEGDELLTGVPRHIDGALHDVAAGVGADLANLDNMWVYAAGIGDWRPGREGMGLALIPSKSALWLRSDGSRFDPPLLAGYDTAEAVERIARQHRQHSWMVMNRRILEREITIQGATFNPGFRDKKPQVIARDLARGNRGLAQLVIDRCPDVVTAADLPTLARKMQQVDPQTPVDEAALTRDVRAYDAEVRRGGKFYTDEQLVSLRSVRAFLNDKLRTCAYAPIEDGGELVAVRTRLTARKSLGGIRTDLASRALDASGAVVPGLYALGEAAGFGGGGMNGRRTLEGTLLGGCILTARQLTRNL